ncbi:MAG: carboxypeptidase regulatory-like domain-containing protein [Deltaproteobacteria bacterium]|nr:carboxypeptidase regulatory-like domain-containing protein [Deltaproteobacteria bacterium]
MDSEPGRAGGGGGGAAAARLAELAALGRLKVNGGTGGVTVLRVLVIDASGRPAAGVSVDGNLLQGDLLEPPQPVLTDAAGQASLRLLMPMGGRATGVLSATAGERLATSDAIEATYPSQRMFAIQIQLAQRSMLRGAVLLDGRPVAGATLQVRTAAFPWAVTARAVSGGDGRYELKLPAPASYRLAAEYQGLTGTSPKVELDDREPEHTVDVTLAAQEFAVEVRDPEQRPLAGVEVRNKGSEVTLAVTDGSGRAMVRGSVVEDEVSLHFGRDGLVPIDGTWDVPEPGDGPMQITMVPALELAGTVTAPPGALVQLWVRMAGEGGFDEGFEGERITVATLQEPGAFRAQLDVEDGRYNIGGHVEGVGDIPPRLVELRRGNLVDVGALEASSARGVMAGLVTDAEGRPQAGAEVKARPRTGRSVVAAVTDAQGRYTLDLPAGEYRVAAFDGPRFIGQRAAMVGAEAATVNFETPACSEWSLPSFDRVTDEGIVVVEALTSGLQPGDRIMEINGEEATERFEQLSSPDPLVANVISPAGVAYEATLTPICIR